MSAFSSRASWFFPNETLHRTQQLNCSSSSIRWSWNVLRCQSSECSAIPTYHSLSPTAKAARPGGISKESSPFLVWYFFCLPSQFIIRVLIYVKHLDSCRKHSKYLISVSHHCYLTAWSAYFSFFLSPKHRLSIKFLVFIFYFTLLPR